MFNPKLSIKHIIIVIYIYIIFIYLYISGFTNSLKLTICDLYVDVQSWRNGDVAEEPR
jgi:hypothetical protein